jgi:1-phosphofructokinase
MTDPLADAHTLRPLLTVTPNPSLDLLFEAERLVWDDANRLDPPRRRVGGQGINAVRAAVALGARGVVVAPFGGRTGDELLDRLRAERIDVEPVAIAGETRTFVGVRVRDGTSLLLNARGAECTRDDEARLLDATRAAIRRTSPAWVACCGSVPPGFDVGFHGRVGEIARSLGARFVADCDDDALRHAQRWCDVLVPNRHEAERLAGRDIGSVAAAAYTAATLRRGGARVVAITLGEDGAVAADPFGAWHAAGPIERAGSAVGAGDAFLAALLLALDAGAQTSDALAAAVAAGGAVLRATGEAMMTRADYEAVLADVRVQELRTA